MHGALVRVVTALVRMSDSTTTLSAVGSSAGTDRTTLWAALIGAGALVLATGVLPIIRDRMVARKPPPPLPADPLQTSLIADGDYMRERLRLQDLEISRLRTELDRRPRPRPLGD